MANRVDKKREILPLISNASIALCNLSESAAKLEYYNNDSASRDFKKKIVDFEHGPLKALKDMAKDIRDEVNSTPKKKLDNRVINMSNLKQYKNK
jgi:hypothetical protein